MTDQIPDTLNFEGQEHRVENHPLDQYFKLAKIEHDTPYTNTALWRGYVGTWEIKNSRLYLLSLTYPLRDESTLSIETYFPGYPNRVFAHWYCGVLETRFGKLLKIWGNWRRTYEHDCRIAIERGVVTGADVTTNEVPGGGTAIHFADTRFA